jgi:hypothetical protein
LALYPKRMAGVEASEFIKTDVSDALLSVDPPLHSV